MDVIQEKLLSMLKEIDKICQENDIQYFLDSGTTLGAVRHHGFIPWDNDADVVMTEDNFYKFVEVVNKTTTETGRTVQHVRMNPIYQAVFGKYIDLNAAKVTVQTPFWDEDAANAGMSIDIFYLVPLPRDKAEKARLMTLLQVYIEFKLECRRYTNRVTDEHIETYYKYAKLAEEIGRDKVIEMMEKELFHRKDEDFDEWMYLTTPRKHPRVFPRAMFEEPPVRVPFEDTYLPISRYAIEEERLFYGDDYWKIPQGDEQRLHIDMQSGDISYRYYLRDFNRFFKEGEIYEARKIYKNGRLIKGFKERDWVFRVCKIYTYRVNKNLQARIEADNLDLMGEYKKGNVELLDDVFAEYYRDQWNIVVKGFAYLILLPEELQYIALMNLLINHDQVGKVSWFLNNYRDDYQPLTPMLQEIMDLLDAWFEVQTPFYYGRYEEGLEPLAKWRKRFPDDLRLQIEELKYEVALMKPEDFDKCLAHADAMLAEHPENTDLIKTKGDIYWNTCDKKTAMEFYDEMYNKTTNGMVRLDVEIKKGIRK